jgi:hypothetical protein
MLTVDHVRKINWDKALHLRRHARVNIQLHEGWPRIVADLRKACSDSSIG